MPSLVLRRASRGWPVMLLTGGLLFCLIGHDAQASREAVVLGSVGEIHAQDKAVAQPATGSAKNAPASPAKASPDKIVELKRKTVEDAAQSQKKVDALSDEAQSALLEYRQLREELLPLRAQNAQMQKMLQNQRAELQSLDRQVEDVAVVRRSLEPLLARMLRVLDDFVALDLPFLRKEREARSQALHDLMESAADSLPTKFRRLLEAYQIEVEYGRSLEAYEEQIKLDGQLVAVELLRVGRVALFYVTMDGKRAGRFDRNRRTWVHLGSREAEALREAIAVANKRIPPRLINIPIEKGAAAEGVGTQAALNEGAEGAI